MSLTCGNCVDYPCDNSGGHLRTDKACHIFKPFQETYQIEDAIEDCIGTLTFQRYGNLMKCVLRYPSSDDTHNTDSIEFNTLDTETINKISEMVFDHCSIDNEKHVRLSLIEIIKSVQGLHWYPKQGKQGNIQAATPTHASQEGTDISNLIEVTKSGKINLVPELTADYIRKLLNVVSFTGKLYVYKDGYYQEGSEAIKTAIVKIVRDTKATVSIREITRDILHYLKYHDPESEYPFNNNTLGMIPFKNGVVKLHFQEGRIELLEHDPKYKFNYIIPHDFNPTNNGDVIHEEIIKKYVAVEDQDILYQIPAQALLQAQGMAPYKKGYLLQGPPHGGKSTYLELLETAFGIAAVSHRSLQALAENVFAMASLENKLLNCYDDLGNVPLKDVGAFKTATGKEYHDIERKGQDSYTARLSAVHVFTCNAPPTYPASVKKDSAFWERWEYIRFLLRFKRDPGFKIRMFTPENISGFLHRVLKTCIDIYNRGLLTNSTAEQVREKWSYNADPVYRYLDEFIEKSNRCHYVDKDDLLAKIHRWSIATNQDTENIPTTIRGLTTHLELFDILSVRKTDVEGIRKEVYQLNGTLIQNDSPFRPEIIQVRTEQGSFN